MNKPLFRKALDAVWLIALGIYVMFGLPSAPFHGDEAMQVYMSNDYATAFIDLQPDALKVSPPYYLDQDNWLRILNGSFNRYAIGLSWHMTGYTTGDLPPRPGWDWGLDYDTNVATHHRPADALLHISRFSSALCFALSIAVIFGIAWQIGGRGTAYLASGLYALHPVLLLNARRAMMEGSMLLFGLLVIFTALLLIRAREREANWRTLTALFALLALTGGLALASKHTAILFVAGGFGGVWLAEAIRAFIKRRLRAIALLTGALIICAVLTLGVFIALSPALWNDPPARLRDLLEQRADLLDIQVTAYYGAGGMPFGERISQIFTQPFIQPLQHFEVDAWTSYTPITAEIDAYMASPLAGIQWWAIGGGQILGIIITVSAWFTILLIWLTRRRPRGGAAPLLYVWLIATIGALLANPLPWQRYYLPLIPILILFAAHGINVLISTIYQGKLTKPAQTALAS